MSNEPTYTDREDEPRLWWGYLHINGHLRLKRFWPSGKVSMSVLEDADESPFVKRVVEPFAAPNSIEAEAKLKRIMENETGEKNCQSLTRRFRLCRSCGQVQATEWCQDHADEKGKQ